PPGPLPWKGRGVPQLPSPRRGGVGGEVCLYFPFPPAEGRDQGEGGEEEGEPEEGGAAGEGHDEEGGDAGERAGDVDRVGGERGHGLEEPAEWARELDEGERDEREDDWEDEVVLGGRDLALAGAVVEHLGRG